jgi:hypothetical protein
MKIQRSRSQPSTPGPADYFTGTVRVDPLVQAPTPARIVGATVTLNSSMVTVLTGWSK